MKSNTDSLEVWNRSSIGINGGGDSGEVCDTCRKVVPQYQCRRLTMSQPDLDQQLLQGTLR